MQVLTAHALAEALNTWGDAVAYVDIETNGRDWWHPSAALAGVALAQEGRDSLSIPFIMQGQTAEPAIMEPLLRFFGSQRLGAHWLPMEVAWFAKRYPAIRAQWVADSFVAATVCGADPRGLKPLTETVLKRPVVSLSAFGVSDFTLLHAQDPAVIDYMEADATNARDLDQHYRGFFGDMHTTYAAEVAAEVALAESWCTGADVDPERLTELAVVLGVRQSTLRTLITGHLGAFDLSSATQTGERLTAAGVQSPLLTPKGTPSWSMDALRAIGDAHPAVPALLEWREIAQQLRGVKQVADARLGGTINQSWFLTPSYTLRSNTPDLTSLPTQARDAFVAPSGWRWIHIRFDEAAELWWMLGWIAPGLLAEGLSDWDNVAFGLGTSRSTLTALARAWVFGRGDAEYMARKTGAPNRTIEAACLAFNHTWAGIPETLTARMQPPAVVVRGVTPFAVRIAENAEDPERAYRQHLGQIVSVQRWAASKALMNFLHSGGIGRCFIPIGDTLAFMTNASLEDIVGIISAYTFRHRPVFLPMHVQAGATWWEASAVDL